MIRPAIRELSSREFDLLVIGAGIHGAFAALEAARRGFNVAVIDSADFGAATSANSMRVLHGGFRYLQRAGVLRLRESARESDYLMGAAPHLTVRLPCVAPLGTGGMPGGTAFRVAFLAHALLTSGRHDSSGTSARTVNRAEYERLCGHFAVPGAAGGAVWYDGFMSGSERLLMNVIRTGTACGVVAANYARCEALIVSDGTVQGARVHDLHGDTTFEIRAARVINAAGACVQEVMHGIDALPQVRFARGCNAIVRRTPQPCAVAVPVADRRMLFAVPFGNVTLLGTWYSSADPRLPAGAAAVSSDVEALLAAFRQAVPGYDIGMADVVAVHAGHVPITEGAAPHNVAASLCERPLVLDHGAAGGVRGVVSLVGVKWTTARAAAVRAVQLATRSLAHTPRRVPSDEPLHGGPTRGGGETVARAPSSVNGITVATQAHLAAVYGSAAHEVLLCAAEWPELLTPLAAGEATIGAQVVHAIRTEQALHLTDVLLRRTIVGLTQHPAPALVSAAAAIAATELDWSPAQTAAEIAAVSAGYPAMR